MHPIAARIRKVRALCDSPIPGEAKAARRKIVELRRRFPTFFNASAKERWRHESRRAGEKFVGPIETALRARIESVRCVVAPALDSVAGLPTGDDWRVELSLTIATVTWPGLLDRLDALSTYRDWQFEIWDGTTAACLRHTEGSANSLGLWIELVEDAIAELRRHAAAQRGAA
jgi:hypothetical protein